MKKSPEEELTVPLRCYTAVCPTNLIIRFISSVSSYLCELEKHSSVIVGHETVPCASTVPETGTGKIIEH